MKQFDDKTYHSKSLYMMVKKTCRNRLTAFTNTDSKNNQASPDIMVAVCLLVENGYQEFQRERKRYDGAAQAQRCSSMRCCGGAESCRHGAGGLAKELLPVGGSERDFCEKRRDRGGLNYPGSRFSNAEGEQEKSANGAVRTQTEMIQHNQAESWKVARREEESRTGDGAGGGEGWRGSGRLVVLRASRWGIGWIGRSEETGCVGARVRALILFFRLSLSVAMGMGTGRSGGGCEAFFSLVAAESVPKIGGPLAAVDELGGGFAL